MHFQTCLFCKRSMEQFCYSIYDPENQPYLNIVQLFGDVEENLRHGRYICHECLYIIRWVYFMKKILADALMEDDIGVNDKVIPAFNIFREKMNQPIFVLADTGESDMEADSPEERYAYPLTKQYIPLTTSKNDSESATNLSNPAICNGEPGEHHQKLEYGCLAAEETCLPPSENILPEGDSNWWYLGQHCSASNEEVIPDKAEKILACGENRLVQYACTIKVCEHKCDTFDELKKHYQLHHLIEQSDLTIANYERQAQEFNKVHSMAPNPRRKKFRCLLSHCRKTFKNNECLSEHKIKEHNFLMKFWCVECNNLPFISRDDLHQHTLIFHPQTNIIQRTNEYPCKFCDKYFLEKNLLSAHQLKHHYLQFLKQTEVVQQSQTSMIKKQMHKSKPREFDKNTHQGMCSFKMRRQKETFKERSKRNIWYNWLKVKFPNFNPTPAMNYFVHKRMNVYANNEQEKVLISLPPRKRRQYQAATEFEFYKTVESVPSNIATNSILTFETKENVSNIINHVQQTQQAVLGSLKNVPDSVISSNLIESTNLSPDDCKCNELSYGEIVTGDTQARLPCTQKLTDQEIISLDHTDESLFPVNEINVTLTQEGSGLCKTSNKEPECETLPVLEVAERNTKLPLKTYNSRKRKKLHQNVTNIGSAHLNKPNGSIENLKEPSPETEMPVLPNAIKETSVLHAVPPVLPPLVRKLEEKDNDSNPGRITMKISLKAIKQYADNKEGKRESKRRKKLKGKKKSKMLQTSNAVINQCQKSDIVSNKGSFVERKSKRLNHIRTKDVENELKMVNARENVLITSQHNARENLASALLPEYARSTSRDISESENETRNEITLNKDEINMIIFGETPNCNNISSDISLVNEQIIDTTEEQVSLVNSTSEQIILTDAYAPSAPAKKKAKSRSRVGKKRKVTRKADKILKLTLDAERKVVDGKELHKPACIEIDADGGDTVEGQIANIKLKDHLYARSAFNAFRHSKWEPSN